MSDATPGEEFYNRAQCRAGGPDEQTYDKCYCGPGGVGGSHPASRHMGKMKSKLGHIVIDVRIR